MEICDEVFWLKECVTKCMSFVILLIVWGHMRLRFDAEALLAVGTFIGLAALNAN